ncbi:MAG: hypothetical protein US62_C0019G0010 [Candidatus Woesebacteria bacterium GW2011_GWA1_37_8]|uniref:Uncharacterized protein n=2 Tax=Candidatus Woeseibacteriota TaxID=1752722 RepID=A0A0G0NKR3_9BACT|nr:MAG: hypothetical protein US39_C0002G0009 [Microgenomates group bacterium GW2011_GWC1_37_12b]KKQ44978.1 MAG: hypothetical protein US62_C0019G0010 [Candidatus Woesebacteria bacterium GW2011_GWA1_37_8]KKQ86504.1 MAG: hypothetical protein UT10_C0023G0006 [Candidatus Woesebacteria bacterium GW2011_GWB1_38_8b]
MENSTIGDSNPDNFVSAKTETSQEFSPIATQPRDTVIPEKVGENKTSTWRTIYTIIALLLFNPLGLLLMFLITKWPKWIKIVVFVILLPFYINLALFL